jgi:HEAT repeat protein
MMRKTAFFIVTLCLPAAAQKEFPELLARVAVYEIGDSQMPLAELRKLVLRGSSSPEAAKQMERSFIEALEGKGTLAGKDQICRHLSLVGSAAAVPALARMLSSTETADMARYALERIPGAAVNQALRDLLPKTSAKVKVGIVNTLGQRQDTGAVAALRALIQDSDPMVAMAAAAALGRIADPAATSALASARPATSGALRAEVGDAYIRCAEQMLQNGDQRAAFAAFQELSASSEPETIRIAALRGIAMSGGKDAVPLLSSMLRTREPRVRAQAIRQLSSIPPTEAMTALEQGFASLDELGKVQVIFALGDRGEKAALPFLLNAAKDGAQAVRAVAWLGLGKVGDASVITVLAEAAAKNATGTEQSRDADVRTGGLPNERQTGPAGGLTEAAAARDSLYRLRGEGIDKAIVAGIATVEPKVKVELIAAASERGIVAATGSLLQSTADSNLEVRRAALRALRGTAGPADVPMLLDLLAKTQAAERADVVRSLSAAVRRSDTASLNPLMSAYRSAPNAELRGSLLSVLAQVGKDESLPVLRSALKDSDPEIRRGAIRALSDWPNTTPMADLREIAGSDLNPAFQALSLQGYIRLIGLADNRSPAETLKLLADAMSLARRAEEKRAILSLVQRANAPAALAIAEAAMKDPEVADEARLAADRIRQRLPPARKRQ